jgi:hypothetical protein
MRSYEKYLLVDELPVIYKQPKESVALALKAAGLDINNKELKFEEATKAYHDWRTKHVRS